MRVFSRRISSAGDFHVAAALFFAAAGRAALVLAAATGRMRGRIRAADDKERRQNG